MRDVAIVSFAQSPSVRSDARNEVEMLMPVVAEAVERSGVPKREIGFTCSGSCDYLEGRPFAFVSAEIVFTLLSLALGEELMGSAVRGIFQGDAHVRGTALEYLETTLPETLRRALWPRIPGAEPTRPSRGSRELAAELLRSSADLRRTR